MTRIAAKTDIGRVRATNQDSMRFGMLTEDTAYAIVCDGMGGHNGGDIASATATEVIEAQLQKGYRKDMSEMSLKSLITTAIINANAKIYSKAAENPELNRMGTTVDVIVSSEQNVYLGHVGDSSIFQVTPTSLVKLTKDHTVVQQLLEEGEISQEVAMNHPQKHYITKAVGVDSSIVPDFDCVQLEYKDMIFMCSDGLTNYLDLDTAHKVLIKNKPQKAVNLLVDMVNENGGGDNVTVVLIY